MENPGRVYTISNAQSARQIIGNNQAPSRQTNGTDEAVRNRFNLINIKSKSSIFKRNDFYKRLSVILCLCILFLFIGLIIVICKFKRVSHNLCESNECLRSAANLKRSMNLSMDPCEDFYQFTCGNWDEEHPNHGWYPTFSSFRLIDERVTLATLKFLNTNATDDEPGPVKETRALYQSCLNEAATDKLGYTVIHKYLRLMGLPLVPVMLKGRIPEDFKFEWQKLSAKIKKQFAMDMVFNFATDADIYNRSHYVMYLSSNLGSSPLPSAFKSKKIRSKFLLAQNDEDTADIFGDRTNGTESRKAITGSRLAIKKIITEVIMNTTGTSKITDETMDNIIEILWNITGDILNIVHQNETDIDDIDVVKFTVAELQTKTDDFLKSKSLDPIPIWKPHLEELFAGISATFDYEHDQIYVLKSEINEIFELAAHISSIPDFHVELYFWWKVVESMIAGTTSEINEYIYKHTSFEYLTYPDIARSKSVDCAQLVSSYMSIAVTYGIADKNFMNVTMPEVKQMLADIKEAFEANVWQMNWMDKDTKKAAIEKSKEMIGLIGFPDWLSNKTAIEENYRNITIQPTEFLENLIQIVQTYIPDMLAIYNDENVKQWRTDPTVVNAFHYVADNSINVPMAILTFPIFHLGLEVLNYGAIGSVLGHELTHGFDNMGKNYDKEGNMMEWWSDRTATTFEEKTKCFIDQYNSFKYEKLNMSVNGRFTLSENLADNGGIHQAFNAYKLYVERNGEESTLPGFDSFTNDQLFFIAYGSIWCETPDLYGLKDQLESDEHSPSYDRIIGSLQNSDDFASAFKCRQGSKMNPTEKKCKIW